MKGHLTAGVEKRNLYALLRETETANQASGGPLPAWVPIDGSGMRAVFPRGP